MTVGKNDLSLSSILVAAGIALVVAWAAAVFLQGWYHQMESSELQRKVIDRPSEALESYKLEQSSELDGYRWIDRDSQVVGLPIERAMELVVDESRGGQP